MHPMRPMIHFEFKTDIRGYKTHVRAVLRSAAGEVLRTGYWYAYTDGRQAARDARIMLWDWRAMGV